MRSKTRALTALAVLAVIALASVALREPSVAPADAAPDLSPRESTEDALGAGREHSPSPALTEDRARSTPATAGEPAAGEGQSADAGAASVTIDVEEVSGRVVDALGAPVAGAAVAVAPFERLGERLADPLDDHLGSSAEPGAGGVEPEGALHKLVTGADGRFVLALPPAESVRLVVRAQGCASFEQTLRPGAHSADGAPRPGIELGDVTLQPGGVLVGNVRTRAGAPVAGAVVRRLDSLERAAAVMHAGIGDVVARTDATGLFRVAELEPGPWKLIICSAAHPDGVFEGAEPGTVEAPLQRDFVLADGARISGRVVGDAAEREGLEVRALLQSAQASPLTAMGSSRTAALDEDGAFRLEGLAPGSSYRVGAWRRGDDPSARPRTDDAVVRSGTIGVELRVVPPTTIEFRAVDASTGAPITEFEVHVIDWNPHLPITLAGPDGLPAFEFPGGVAVFPVLRPSAARAVTLIVWGRHHAPRVLPGLVCTPGLRLGLGDVALQPAVKVEVTVLRADDGLAVAEAVVSIRSVAEDGTALEAVLNAPTPPSWRSVRTDENGRAVLTGLPRAATTLAVFHRNFAPRGPVSIGDAELATGRVEVRLEPR